MCDVKVLQKIKLRETKKVKNERYICSPGLVGNESNIQCAGITQSSITVPMKSCESGFSVHCRGVDWSTLPLFINGFHYLSRDPNGFGGQLISNRFC